MKIRVLHLMVLATFLIAFQRLNAQTERIVKVSGINPKDTAQTRNLVYDQLFTAIKNDAPNRVAGVITKYELQRGQVYLNVSSIDTDFDLYLIASAIVPGADAQKNYNPVILTSLTQTGGSNPVLKPKKNLYLENIELDGLLPNGKLPARLIEIGGLATTITLKGCKLQNCGQAHITIMVDDVSLYIYDCVIGNSGHLQGYGGNGRTIDNRAPLRVKEIVVQNSTCYNNTDRFIRSMLGQSIKKIKIDHVSYFNSTGRHGCFQLARAEEIEITNNIIVNPISFGDRVMNKVNYREEQTQRDKAFAVFTHDSTKTGQPVTQKVTMRNNNIYHETKFEDFFNKVTNPDTVKSVRVLNDCLAGWAGSNANNALWFREELKFNSTSSSDDLLAYVTEWYKKPTSATFTAYNFSKIFAFEWDVKYPTTSKSYTAGDNGFPLGDLNAWPDRKAQWAAAQGLPVSKGMETEGTVDYGFSIDKYFPNPFSYQTTVFYSVKVAQKIDISVYYSYGQKAKTLFSGELPEGDYNVSWDGTDGSGSQLPRGLYMIHISGQKGRVVKKVIKN
jgi:hypothetical protein